MFPCLACSNTLVQAGRALGPGLATEPPLPTVSGTWKRGDSTSVPRTVDEATLILLTLSDLRVLGKNVTSTMCRVSCREQPLHRPGCDYTARDSPWLRPPVAFGLSHILNWTLAFTLTLTLTLTWPHTPLGDPALLWRVNYEA